MSPDTQIISAPFEQHTFCPGAPLLIRGDLDSGRFCYQKLAAALASMGLRGTLTLEGFKIEPAPGTSARTN